MRTDRLLGITMVLLERERVSARSLAQMFEVSVRTIYRDVEAIAMAGVPVFSTPGPGGGIQIMPGYKLDKSVFTTDDLSSLLVALSGLDGVLDQGVLAKTRAKVRALVPDGRVSEEVALGADRVRIDRSPWLRNRNVDGYLEQIRGALERRNPVRISYLGAGGRESDRVIEPCQIVLKDGSLYVYAWCRMRCDFRLFKLARILGMEVLDGTFDLREHPVAELDAAPHVRELQEDITLRIERSLAEHLLDFCPFEDFVPDGDGHYLVRFPFIDRDYYYGVLLSFGEGCEVVAPPHIREKMVQKTARLAELYSGAGV